MSFDSSYFLFLSSLFCWFFDITGGEIVHNAASEMVVSFGPSNTLCSECDAIEPEAHRSFDCSMTFTFRNPCIGNQKSEGTSTFIHFISFIDKPLLGLRIDHSQQSRRPLPVQVQSNVRTQSSRRRTDCLAFVRMKSLVELIFRNTTKSFRHFRQNAILPTTDRRER